MKITSKYTFIYRLVGVVGCLLVIGSIFLPWVTINAGVLGDFQEGDSPTGYSLANLEKGDNWDVNIFAYLFMIVWAFLILSPIGIIIILLGKDGRGIGYYLIVMAIFFLVLIMMLMPLIQESIPIPENPYDSMSQEDMDNLSDAQRAKLDEELAYRDSILNMKKIKIGPAIGVIITVVGGFVTYIGSRLVLRDSERLRDIYNYYILLVEAHKGGRITKEEEDLLSAQRKMFRIRRDEHEMLLKKMFPDEKRFQNALYMHDHPVDMDRLIIEKSLQDYEVFLTQAYGHEGNPTKEELQMLEVIRRTLNISMDDHYMVLDYLRAEGKVRKKRKRPEEKSALAEVPDELDSSPSKTPRYVQSWQYRSTITREEPLEHPQGAKARPKRGDMAPPERGPPKRTPPPKPTLEGLGEPMSEPSRIEMGPPRPAHPPKSKPPEPPAPAKIPLGPPAEDDRNAPRKKDAPKGSKRPKKVKCTKCGTTIPVPSSEGPVTIKCPGCGITGKV